jgi:hypothetical protein
MTRLIRNGMCCLIAVIVRPSMLLAQGFNESGNPILVNWTPKDYRGVAESTGVAEINGNRSGRISNRLPSPSPKSCRTSCPLLNGGLCLGT